MSEQERRWKRRDGGVNWVLRDGALRLHIGTTEMASSQTIEGLEQHPNVIETFDHLPNPIPAAACQRSRNDHRPAPLPRRSSASRANRIQLQTLPRDFPSRRRAGADRAANESRNMTNFFRNLYIAVSAITLLIVSRAAWLAL